MWTDEQAALAIDLRSKGRSASQIAHAIPGMTRNTVIGLFHRRHVPTPLLLTKRIWGAGELAEAAKLRAEGQSYADIGEKFGVSSGAMFAALNRRGLWPPKPQRDKPAAPPREAEWVQRDSSYLGCCVPLIDIEPQGCRWPVKYEDDQHLFCGDPNDSSPYCAGHHKLAVQS